MRTEFKTGSHLAEIHRSMVLIAIFAFSLAAVSWFAAGAFFGIPRTTLAVTGPAIVAVAGLGMHLRRRYRGDVIVATAIIEMLVVVTLSGRQESILASALGFIVLLSSGVMFVPRRRRGVYVGFAGVVATIAGLLWSEPGHRLPLAAWMGISAIVMGGLFAMVYTRSDESARRYRTLFAGIPAAAVIQDWSAARRRVDELTRSGVTDLRQHLLDDRAELRRLATSVRIVDVNDSYVSLLSAPSREALIGPWDERRITERSIDHLITEFEHLRDGVSSGNREWESRDYRGEPMWLRIDWHQFPEGAFPDADRLVTVSDLTALKDTQRELQGLLDEKDRLVASISHELRTPLTAVVGFAELLEDRDLMPEHEQAVIRKLLISEARDMADIIEDLLVAARARMGAVSIDCEKVDLVQIVTSTAGAARSEILVPPHEPLTAIADAGRVGQILRNLVGNSIKHGGPHRRIAFEETADSASIEVRDDGDGIPQDLVDQIFEPYVSAGDQSGMAPSMGLGLWVSRALAELMSGRLEAERDGDETVFRLTLPRA